MTDKQLLPSDSQEVSTWAKVYMEMENGIFQIMIWTSPFQLEINYLLKKTNK